MSVAIWMAAAMFQAQGDAPSPPVQPASERPSLECAEGVPALSDIRARLAVSYGTDTADKACAAFVATGSERFGRLAVVAVPTGGDPKGDRLFGLYGLRRDGGWTDLTEGTFLYNPDTDSLRIGRGANDMPSVHVERGRSRVVHVFDPDRGTYWAVRAE